VPGPVLVTGGTGGIGYQTAQALVRSGASVIITGRDAEAGERAAAAIRGEHGEGRLSWTQMTRSMTPRTIPALRVTWPLLRLVQRCRSPERAGRRVASLVASAVAGTATGQYFEAGHTPRRLPARALDPELQLQAWELGRRLVADAAAPAELGEAICASRTS